MANPTFANRIKNRASILCPSREEHLLSDHIITIFGRSITITAHDLFLAGLSILIGAFFWVAMYFARRRVVVLKHSSAIDQISLELARIANSLERIANRPADCIIAAATRRQQSPEPQLAAASAARVQGYFVLHIWALRDAKPASFMAPGKISVPQ